MTEAEVRCADYTARQTVAVFLESMQDKDTVAKIGEAWGGEVDRYLGRGIRRALWYILLALAGIASVKFGLIDKALGWLK